MEVGNSTKVKRMELWKRYFSTECFARTISKFHIIFFSFLQNISFPFPFSTHKHTYTLSPPIKREKEKGGSQAERGSKLCQQEEAAEKFPEKKPTTRMGEGARNENENENNNNKKT